MKILIISFLFPPYNNIGSVRVGKTAKLLTQLGYDVKVIAGNAKRFSATLPVEIPLENVHYLDYISIEDLFFSIRTKLKEFVGIHVHYKFISKSFIESDSKKFFFSEVIYQLYKLYNYLVYVPDKEVLWYFPAVRKAKEILASWKPDIIFASALPYTSLLVGYRVSKITKIPFIAELRDLWSDNHNLNFNFLNKIMEKKVLNHASAIVTVSNPLVEKLKKKYPPQKIYEINNAFDKEDFIIKHIIDTDDTYYNSRSKDKILITYTGSLYFGKMDPSKLFEAICKFKELKNLVLCKFYGEGNEWLLELAKRYNCVDNIEVHPPVSRKESLKLQSESDILLLLLWNDPSELGVYTGKFFEYIGSAKPILAIGCVDNVAAISIKKYGFGIVTSDIYEIRDFIINSTKQDFLNLIYNNYKLYRNLFAREHQVKKLTKIFEEVLYKKSS